MVYEVGRLLCSTGYLEYVGNNPHCPRDGIVRNKESAAVTRLGLGSRGTKVELGLAWALKVTTFHIP
jgi:hypothetical protein